MIIRNLLKTTTVALAIAGTSATAQAQRSEASLVLESAQASAPIELTGQWVSLVTEDWRWRMITPPLGDYTSVPLNEAGVAKTREWDLAADNAAGRQCLAYGAGGLLRLPLRMRFSWADGNTLQLETDAGRQLRKFRFVTAHPGAIVPALESHIPAPDGPTLQGFTRAQWHKYPQSRGLGFGSAVGEGGALRAVTRDTIGGYLRKNGVPYSSEAVITEQFNLVPMPSGETYLVLTTMVEDPTFLTEPFIVSSSFKKEDEQSKWSPEPCHTDEPLEPSLAENNGP